MMNWDALTYGDLVAFISCYPADATMLVDHLADEDWTTDYAVAPNNVGQALAHARTMPEDGIPLIKTTAGSSKIIGIYFGTESPIFVLLPV